MRKIYKKKSTNEFMKLYQNKTQEMIRKILKK